MNDIQKMKDDLGGVSESMRGTMNDMSTKQFIEDAIAGGWRNHPANQAYLLFDSFDNAEVFVNGFGWAYFHKKGEQPDGGTFAIKSDSFKPHEVLLDPLAWQAVGKTRGWAKNQCSAKFRSTMMKIFHGLTIEEALSKII